MSPIESIYYDECNYYRENHELMKSDDIGLLCIEIMKENIRFCLFMK